MDNALESNETRGRPPARIQGIMSKFEVAVVTTLELLVVLTVAVGTIKLFIIFFDAMPTQIHETESADALQPVLQNAYGGVLMVLLGLELLQTLKAYFRDHHLQIEVILVVAMVAVGRHIIQIDVGHTPGTELAGLAILIASLAASYFLVKKAHFSLPRLNPALRPTERAAALRNPKRLFSNSFK
jgi:uncharacterized membrane protein (DUF373 family)